jgi:hypothetical protein
VKWLWNILSHHRDDKLFQLNAYLCLLISFVYGEKSNEAETIGFEAMELLDHNDKTPGLASILEYYGAALVLNGKVDEGKKFVDLAFDRLYVPGRSPLG